ncbi:peptide/nickel transport system permease protein [Tamaricihabitans halophyticus]|uniref:Peptide/nickel transport system permease protein n=1 Tax=Tamaricihabitans halophyticus TaxID=1262583 RepID=A0A4R2QVC2_9PSEU|nr:ABC transporter permease [Tamaricihabitans halophyticus]TCP53019.1 peptide/nickel transport system permease protein [Tamaricihabitans halophyticus]
MRTFLARRAGLALIQLFVVGTIVFLLARLIPGDPARAVLGDNATEDQVAQVRELMNLDAPQWEQYFGFWGNLLRGDLGVSLISGRTVLEDLPVRMGNSLELVLLALALAMAIGIPLGRLAATKANKAIDHIVTGGAILGISLPVFVLGTLLLLVLGVWWPVLPPERFVSFAEDPLTHLRVLLLPVLTLTAASTAVVARMTRSAMLETLSADYVRTARAKGLREKHVVRRHALRAAMLPIVSVSSVELTTLIGSTVLVESIFGWPGMSSLLMNAVTVRDYPVIQAVVLATATIVIVVNLIADITVRALDPRAESV